MLTRRFFLATATLLALVRRRSLTELQNPT